MDRDLHNDTSGVIRYPPEPWELRGQMHLTAWRVPAARLPRLSAGLQPVRAGGTALVVTAWVIYEPGGVLCYRELLVAVLVHRSTRPLATITDIWVDSAPSLHGGRKLWGIPKQWASFHIDGATCAATDADGELIASAAVRPIGVLPGRWRGGYTLAQQRARAHPHPGPLQIRRAADPDQLGVRPRWSARVARRRPPDLLDVLTRLHGALRTAVSRA